MLKQLLLLILSALVVIAMMFLYTSVPFVFFIIFPALWIIPLFYFRVKSYRFMICVFFMIAMALVVIVSHGRSWDVSLYSLFYVGFGALFYFYWSQWETVLTSETIRNADAQRDLEQLQGRYTHRLQSLQHLEKQVSGLLDLFEIAKHFSDCMSFERISEVMQKEVLPEIPAERMFFYIVPKDEEQSPQEKYFIITASHVQVYNEMPAGPIRELVKSARETHQLVKDDRRWAFPLMSDGQMRACFIVEEAHADDLAKFEVLSAYLAMQVKKVNLYETVRELSITDGLTRVFVRRHFLERFEEELKRSLKYQLPLAVLMLDIDHFKRYNDDHGHLAGDATLRQVAHLLTENLRKVDIVARYGGEEFVIVIPETKKEGAMEVAERIRSQIAHHVFSIYNTHTRVTVSIGVSAFSGKVISSRQDKDIRRWVQDMIEHADQALYQAKEEGRNRVILSQQVL